jgi:hypothetical protein
LGLLFLLKLTSLEMIFKKTTTPIQDIEYGMIVKLKKYHVAFIPIVATIVTINIADSSGFFTAINNLTKKLREIMVIVNARYCIDCKAPELENEMDNTYMKKTTFLYVRFSLIKSSTVFSQLLIG